MHTTTMQAIVSSCPGARLYPRYSGRGMFGKQCWGISGSDKVAIIEAAAANGITGARYDQLGMGWIVYWPHLSS